MTTPAARLAVTLLATAMLVASAVACPSADQGFRRLASADAEIAYRWEPERLQIGHFFAAEVVACRSPGGEPVSEIRIDATMPAHGHGMNYRPAATRAGPGHYKFTGLMLHMPGTWRIAIDLLQGPRRTRLTQDISLTP